MPSDVAFSAHAVTKSFGDRRALDAVDVSIGRGEMVALIGPSGSGKSTLLRTLTGLVRIDAGAGSIESFGDMVQAQGRVARDVRRVRARVGFVFQQFNLVGRLSLHTNVMIGALGRIGFWRGLLGRWPAADRRDAMAALARVGVAEHAAARARTLSGGQQQRGAIARCLVQRACAILADEPVASLDPVAARGVLETLRALNRDHGLTVVVSLHHVEDATRYCDRVIALRAGRVVYDGSANALDAARVAAIYGADAHDASESEACG